MARKSEYVGAHSDIRDSRGRHVDDAYVQGALRDARRAGRPSLTGASVSSPQIVVRVTPGLKRDAAELAARKGLSLSELTRQALDEFVKRAG